MLDTLKRFFAHEAPIARGDRVLVAFSGGPDSVALLWGLRELSRELGISVAAAHLDHALDPGSAERAIRAHSLAAAIGVPFHCQRLPIEGKRDQGLEAEARRQRYRYLEQQRQAFGARYIATAHHGDDQAETLLLRMLFGTGIEGLAGIRAVLGNVVRPLLSLTSAQLLEIAARQRLEPTDDPTNSDLERPRNWIRHSLLPKMTLEQPDLVERLVRLAQSTCAMRSRLDARLGTLLSPHPRGSSPAKGVAIDRAAFAGLPEELQRYALRYTHRCALRPYPPSRVAQSELLSQLARDRAVGCDCGDGWRWSLQGGELELAPTRPKTPPFTYTLSVPGAVELDELSLRIRVRPERVSPWMFRASRDRAAMALPLLPGDRVTIRNRRSGDRIQPFGWERHCRVKELLINRRVPQERRSRLPFLCYEGTIAWIPGVTVNERFRLSSQETAWVAEIEAIEPTR